MAGVNSASPEPASDEIEFDPPLGFVPDFTFRSPVMSGSSARWKKGGGSEGLLRIMRHESNVSTYHSFMRYVVAMAVVPAVTMFVMHNFVLDHLFTFSNNGDRMAYAGVAAIVSVQLVIVKFLIFAFNEDPKTGEQIQPPAKSKST